MHVASWYDGCMAETMPGLCFGSGSGFGGHLPWLGLTEAVGVVRSALSSVLIKESARENGQTDVWVSMSTVEDHMSTFGVHGGTSPPGNVIHLMSAREVVGVSLPDPPSSDVFHCLSCGKDRAMGPTPPPSTSSSSALSVSERT